MINHIVLFKLKNYSTTEEKKEVLNQFKSKLLALKNYIPELKHIEVGQNYQVNAASYDLSLITHFDSFADLEIYRVHPEHLKVGDFVKEIVVERAAVDSEF
ncbi:MAG: Dabb family protein [Prolixibacteraceae bacterium]|jgi:response regulator of citrate/malate metabolism|nr:Dabb family protein [Prolixibacteraceae bacterium]